MGCELPIIISTLAGNVLLKCTLGISAFSCLLVDFSEVCLYLHKAFLYLPEPNMKAGAALPSSWFGPWDGPTPDSLLQEGLAFQSPPTVTGSFSESTENGREGGQCGLPDTLHQLWLFVELPLGYLVC